MGTYAEQAAEFQSILETHAPPEAVKGLAAARAELSAGDFASNAPGVGDSAPSFELSDCTGAQVSLAGLVSTGPAILIFYRGASCPFCNLQLRAFSARLAEFAQHDAQLVAISPQTPDRALLMTEQANLAFPVLFDEGARVAERYGLAYAVDERTQTLMKSIGSDVGAFNGPTGWVLPAPGTFVVDIHTRVTFAAVDGDWRRRPETVALAFLGAIEGAVIELAGQAPHDELLAARAGAGVLGLDGIPAAVPT